MSDERPVYMIANLSITNHDEYAQYTNSFIPILESFGGNFVTYDDEPVTLEGQSPRKGRMVIFRFPSEHSANDWYRSEAYQAISEHRRSGSKLEFLTMVRGLISNS